MLLGTLYVKDRVYNVESTDYGVTCSGVLTSNGSGSETAYAVLRYIKDGYQFTLHRRSTPLTPQAKRFMDIITAYLSQVELVGQA